MSTGTFAAPPLATTAWTTPAIVDWPTLLTSSVGSVIYQQSVAHHYHSLGSNSNMPPTSLNGYAFFCDGLVIALEEGDNENDSLYCQSGGDSFDCGAYRYNAPFLSISLFDAPMIAATDLLYQDSVLLSFASPDTGSCHVVSLDWQQYSLEHYFGISCPKQQQHFALGLSGDVALRSQHVVSETNTIVRDSYGVYQYKENDAITMYFGPQQGRQVTVLEGKLSDSQLALGSVEEPCTHDGSSTISTVQDLPRTNHQQQSRPTRKRRRIAHFMQSLLLKHLGGLHEKWALLQNSWFFLLVRSGFWGQTGIGVTTTAILSQLVRNWYPPHPSYNREEVTL